MELELLWEGLLWFRWSWRLTQTSSACFRLQTWHWHARWHQMLRDWFILPALTWTHKFSCKAVFTKITSLISKLWSVFEDLGLGSKCRDRTAFRRTEWRKKFEPSQGIPKSWWQRQSPSSTRQLRGDCKLAWISAIS